MKHKLNNKLSSSKIARIISNAFIPPVNLLYLFLYLGYYFEGETSKRIIVILIAIIFGFVLPVSLFFYLRHKNKISNEDATNKEERQIPYLFSTLFAIIAMLVLLYFDTSTISILAWLSYVINTIILITINKYWKISAHAIGIASPWAIILYTNFSLFPIFVIILLLVGWSRIKLNVHTLPQVISGSLLGYFFTLSEIIIGLNLVK